MCSCTRVGSAHGLEVLEIYFEKYQDSIPTKPPLLPPYTTSSPTPLLSPPPPSRDGDLYAMDGFDAGGSEEDGKDGGLNFGVVYE